MESNLHMATAGDRRMARAAHIQTLHDAIEALPDGVTGEILDGQLHTQPRPAPRHAVAASNLGAELIGPYARGRGGPGGWWVIIEPELHFVRGTDILVPDLAGWRRERMPEIPSGRCFETVPDWVCEILSPATRSKDREIKLPLYAHYGVAHAWLVDPAAETLEAYSLHDGQWQPLAAYTAADTVAAAPFEAATFRVLDLWT